MIVGNLPDEWPGKYKKDKFDIRIMKEVKKEKMVPKTVTVTQKRQKMVSRSIEEEVKVKKIEQNAEGKYVQEMITKKKTKEVTELVFEEVDLFDEAGNEMGKTQSARPGRV